MTLRGDNLVPTASAAELLLPIAAIQSPFGSSCAEADKWLTEAADEPQRYRRQLLADWIWVARHTGSGFLMRRKRSLGVMYGCKKPQKSAVFY